MYTIIINTASYLSEIKISDTNNKIITEISKYAQFNEYEILTNWLKNQDYKVLNKISKIICVIGPGSFTGIRIGTTIANTIAFIKQIPIYTIDAFDYISQIQANNKLPIIIDAGKNEFYIKQNNNIVLVNIDYIKLKYNKLSCIVFAKDIIKEELSKFINLVDYFDIQKKLTNFNKLKKVQIAIPLYIRQASITLPKNKI